MIILILTIELECNFSTMRSKIKIYTIFCKFYRLLLIRNITKGDCLGWEGKECLEDMVSELGYCLLIVLLDEF